MAKKSKSETTEQQNSTSKVSDATPQQTAPELFQKLLRENNLVLDFERQRINYTDSNGIVISEPSLRVSYGRKPTKRS